MIIFPGSIFWRMPLFQTLGQSLNRGTTSVDDAVPGIQTCRWSHRDRRDSFFVSANWPQPQPTPPREGQQWCTELAPALSAIALDQLASQLANGSCARKMSLGKSGFPRPTSFHLVPPRSAFGPWGLWRCSQTREAWPHRRNLFRSQYLSECVCECVSSPVERVADQVGLGSLNRWMPCLRASNSEDKQTHCGTNIVGLALVKVDKISNVAILAPLVYDCTCIYTFQTTYILQSIHVYMYTYVNM
jgi:hypothetical protein